MTLESNFVNVVAEGLRSIGYGDELLLNDYAYSDLPVIATSAKSVVRRVQLAAFAQSPPSMRNACFGVTTVPDDGAEHIEPLRVLGAPAIFALCPRVDYVQMWRIPASGVPTQHQRIDIADVTDTFRRKAAEWNPQTVLRAKRITFLNDAP